MRFIKKPQKLNRGYKNRQYVSCHTSFSRGYSNPS